MEPYPDLRRLEGVDDLPGLHGDSRTVGTAAMLTTMTNEQHLIEPARADAATASRGQLPAWLLPAVAGVAGLIVGIGGTLSVQAIASATGTPEVDTRLHDASGECMVATGITEGDNGRTLTIDVKGQEDVSGATYDAQACILNELNAPSSAISHIEQTTSMDGRQTESWDGITIEWSYHPDRGSDMVIKMDTPED